MTDSEIIEGLKCCANNLGCHNCSFKKHATCFCVQEKEIYDLITRQQAEIENLKVENQSLRGAANPLKMHYEEAQAEIERLEEDNFIKSQKRANIFEITDAYERGKSEAVKEFAERLKEKKQEVFTSVNITELAVTEWTIDNLVKEMVGDK